MNFTPICLAPSSPKTGSPRRRGLDKCLTTTCVTSVAELTELVLQAQQRFAEVYQSKDNKLISHVDWASNALQTLYYFMKCSHQIDEDISDILAATRRYRNRVYLTTNQTVILNVGIFSLVGRIPIFLHWLSGLEWLACTSNTVSAVWSMMMTSGKRRGCSCRLMIVSHELYGKRTLGVFLTTSCFFSARGRGRKQDVLSCNANARSQQFSNTFKRYV